MKISALNMYPLPLLQLGAMISTEPTVLDACGGLIPDSGDMKALLLHQQAKGLIGVKGILPVLESFFIMQYK